jgi:hypothetical protein
MTGISRGPCCNSTCDSQAHHWLGAAMAFIRASRRQQRDSRSSELAPAGTLSDDAEAPGCWAPSLSSRICPISGQRLHHLIHPPRFQLPKPESAATVTRGAARSSAWLLGVPAVVFGVLMQKGVGEVNNQDC